MHSKDIFYENLRKNFTHSSLINHSENKMIVYFGNEVGPGVT